MPITLFTGMPGAGKTAQMVAELKKLQIKEPGRPVFVDGINGLKLDHQPIDARTWHTELPDGALLVVDEAQRLWRPRGSGSKVPDEIQAMETHRHRGIDIWMTTQAPRLVDSNVRGLVGRHVHLRDTGFLGRWWYEWPECNEGVSWKTCPVKIKHKLPKDVFNDYRSASEHTKTSRRIPPALIVVAVCLVVGAALAWSMYRSISGKRLSENTQTTAPASSISTQAANQVRPLVNVPVHVTDPTAFTPRWAGRPESAPAFDHLVQVKTFPRVIGGYCLGKDQARCSCITQQGTDAGLSDADCRQWHKRRPFDPYQADQVEVKSTTESAPPAAAAPSPL